jgi:uncharacterized protein
VSENTEALRRAYDAFNSGDVQAVLEVFADDVRWEGPNTEGVPMGGVHEGKDAVAEALARIGETFESFEVSPDEMIEDDGTVVALSHIEARAKGSGGELKQPSVEVFRMRDGKAVHVQSLLDTAQVLEVTRG